MLELDGRTYTVDDATTNAYNILNYINQFMIDNDVKKKNGNYVQFKISLASPMWLICFGIGYMATVAQKIMYACAQAFNIGSCSDAQVLELAKVARLTRKQGSYTNIVTAIKAKDTGACYLPSSLTVTVKYNGDDYVFHPVNDVYIQAGGQKDVVLVCTVPGPVYLAAGSITEFDSEVENLDSIISSAANPGTNLETIRELRTRLMTNEAVSPLDGATQGLNALEGVVKAVVLFNDNYDSPMMLAGKEVPPRRALVFVQGDSNDLAKEYYKHMSAQTFAEPGVSLSKSYTMLNGQTFTMNYFAPVARRLYIKIMTKTAITIERQEEIQHTVSNLSNSLAIGKDYTQAYIIDSIDASLDFPEIVGCEISTDGTNWGVSTAFNEGDIGLIPFDDITIEPIDGSDAYNDAYEE